MKGIKKLKKYFLFFKIIASEYGTTNSHNSEKDTCNRESMC